MTSRHRSIVLAASALGLCAVASCAPVQEAELLRVHRVSPDQIEPGHPIRVRGGGFPPGRAARVELDGTFHRPGREPREVHVELSARAVSAEQVVARFEDSEYAAIGGRGTLHGHATVIFEASDGSRVFGRSPAIVLDVRAAGVERLGRELAQRRSAEELSRALGLAFGEEAPDRAGLPITAIADGSPASRGGLAVGDRVVGIGALSVHAWSDFVPAPDASTIALRVLRDGEAAPFEVRLPRATETSAIDRNTLRTGQAIFAWLLFTALFIAPTASATEWLSRRRDRSARRRSWLGYAVAIAAAAALGALGRAGGAHVPLEWLALGLIVLCAAQGFGTPATDRRRRIHALARSLGAGLAIGSVFAGAAALAGTTDAAALIEAQGPAPWQWTGLRTPMGLPWIALALLLAAPSSAPSWLDRAIGFTVACLVAAILLGGWNLAPGDGLPLRLAGVAVFVAKAFGCQLAMERIGVRWELVRPWKRAVVGAGLTALGAAGAAAWIAHGAPAELEVATGQVVSGAFVVVALAWIVRRASGPRATAEPAPAHPFL